MSKLVRLVAVILLVGLGIIPCFTSSPVNATSAPADAYWVGGSGNTSDTANHWANVSGGLPDPINMPDDTSNVHFDANSSGGGAWTVTVDTNENFLTMDWTGATDTPVLAGGNSLSVYGNLTLIPAMTCPFGGILHFKTNDNVFDTGNITLGCEVEIDSGSLKLADNLSIGSNTFAVGGDLDTNNKTINCGAFSATAGSLNIEFCTSTVWCDSFSLDPTNIFNCGYSYIRDYGDFNGGDQTYWNVFLYSTPHTVSGNNTIREFAIASNAAETVKFTDGDTQTIQIPYLNGSAGNIHILQGTGSGGWYLIKSGGSRVFSNFVTLTDSNVSPSNIWYYGLNSTVGIGNNGWNLGEFLLNYSTDGQGTITGNTTQLVWYRQNGTTVTAVPNGTLEFYEWNDSVTSNPRTDTNVTGDVNVQANFSSVVVFPDAALNASVCSALGIPNGSQIYQAQLDTITAIDAQYCVPSITNLEGLEYWTTANWLNLAGNNITDVSPLTNLTTLTQLYLSENNITDVSPLAGLVNLSYLELQTNPNLADVLPLTGLTNLIWLQIDQDNLSDISPLASLTNLTMFLISNNHITNISSMAGMTGMVFFMAGDNNIIDISPLTGLTNLVITALQNNNIVDISSFVGTRTSGFLNIMGNPLNTRAFTTDILALLAAGVTVTNDTPYILTYTAGAHGTISGIDPQYVGPTFNGTTVTAVPNTNYYFDSWSDGSTQNPRLDTNVGSDINVTANFYLSNSGLWSLTSVLPFVFVGIGLVLAVGMFATGEGLFGIILLVLSIVITIVGVALIQGMIP